MDSLESLGTQRPPCILCTNIMFIVEIFTLQQLTFVLSIYIYSFNTDAYNEEGDPLILHVHIHLTVAATP